MIIELSQHEITSTFNNKTTETNTVQRNRFYLWTYTTVSQTSLLIVGREQSIIFFIMFLTNKRITGMIYCTEKKQFYL